MPDYNKQFYNHVTPTDVMRTLNNEYFERLTSCILMDAGENKSTNI